MVAALDTYIYFVSKPAFDRWAKHVQERSKGGGGRIVAALLGDEITTGVDAARGEVGGAPLGVVTETETQAIEAIATGADEATVLTDEDEAQLTAFLDRVKVRAQLRMEGKRQQQDLVQAERLTALGTLVAGVAHEMNNPLSTITLGFDVLRTNLLRDLQSLWLLKDDASDDSRQAAAIAALEFSPQEAASLLGDLDAATASVTELVRDLRVFSRSDVAERPTVFSARAAIEQALRLVRREFGPRTIVEQDYENDLPKLCLPKNRLAQILTNLLLNAAHAMREVDRPLHRIRITARSDDQHIALSISDTGPGIPADSLEKIFDPFYTTKRESQGTGLGLSISRSIVQHLGGDLAVSSFDGQGATFVCFLPLPSEQELESAERRRSPTPTAQLDPARQTVLIVEDDPHVLRAVSRVLGEEFKVLVAADGQEAIEVLSSGAKVDAIITEIALPEVDGPEFFAWIARENPELLDRIVVATAAQERTRYHEFLRRQKPTVLHKPLTRERVLSAVRQAANPKANSRSASS